MQSKYDKLLHENQVSKFKANLLAMGYDEKLADELPFNVFCDNICVFKSSLTFAISVFSDETPERCYSVFSDSESAYTMSMKYYEEQQAKAVQNNQTGNGGVDNDGKGVSGSSE